LRVTHGNLVNLDPQSAHDIRIAGRPMAQFSTELWAELKQVREFLFTRMYRAPSVVAMRKDVSAKVRVLFPHFMEKPYLLPREWQVEFAHSPDEQNIARVVCDYIAGMTDRFALQQYEQLLNS